MISCESGEEKGAESEVGVWRRWSMEWRECIRDYVKNGSRVLMTTKTVEMRKMKYGDRKGGLLRREG
jgi:hypothetical protein